MNAVISPGFRQLSDCAVIVACDAGYLPFAAALLALGRKAFRRTAVSGAERGPWCLMGVCHDCLVTVDGRGNVQGCLVPLRAGMAEETGGGRRDPER